jgi:galactonate dehydratase
MSGIEQALWDITGKAYGQPVYKLLGGAHGF